nr:MAG TPA: hypothetical protein [Caudoviricetes sp.]
MAKFNPTPGPLTTIKGTSLRTTCSLSVKP